jgi:CDP-paratose 2-epimerase
LRQRPLEYIGYGGKGYQVRDCLHPRDLVPLLVQQTNRTATRTVRTVNLGGGTSNVISLAQLSNWCRERFGSHEVHPVLDQRRFDIPWLIMDATTAENVWGWKPQTPMHEILEEIACHAEKNPAWLDFSRTRQ